MLAVIAATCQVLSTESPVDDGHRLASYETSLVVSGGVDCGRRRRNVYDKKPRRYAKDNRTAHLTARNDKCVIYVTNNKSLYSTFCTVEANYWQTRSISRPLCDSRATCLYRLHFVLLKLTTDRHEASRGLSAIAELLVCSQCNRKSNRWTLLAEKLWVADTG